MLRKYKQFIIGIVIGIMIAAVPVGAAVQQYTLKQSEWTVVVDGQAVEDEKYPVLLMDPGYNYVAAGNFREICAKAGLPFDVNAEAKEIRISTTSSVAKTEIKTEPVQETKPTAAPTVVPTKAPTPIPTQKPKEEKTVEVPLNKYGLPDFSTCPSKKPHPEDDGTNVYFTFNGIKYISIYDLPNHPKLLPENYRFERDMVDGKLSDVIAFKKKNPETNKWETLIAEVPYTDMGFLSVEYDYYNNTIKPLITN